MGMTHPVGTVPPSPTAWSKMGDIAKAYIAVAIGYVLGYVIGYVVERGTNVLYIVNLMWFVGPLVFLLLALGFRSPEKHVSAARLIGAFAGWSAFILLFHYPPVRLEYWAFVTTWSPLAVILSGLLLAGALVASCLVLGDVVWARLRRTPSSR